MGKVKAVGLSLNKKKCRFFKKEVKILGNIVTEEKIKTDPDKVKTIQEYPEPTTIKELRSFLGVVNYCREFVPKFAMITAPLYGLLKGVRKESNKRISMDTKQREAFRAIRKTLTENTERAQPNMEEDFILTTDASDTGIGAVLSQLDKEGRERMISTFSKTLDKAQLNYSVTDKELLGIVKSIENFRHYLLGKTFKLRTDHKALIYLWNTKTLNSRLLRWSLKLQEYTFDINYIKGDDNIADGYSRNTTKIDCCNIQIAKQAERRDEILTAVHELLGHGSPNNMKFYMKDRYKWDSMYRDITNFCEKCAICKKSGGPRINTKFRVIETTRPNELWQVDLIGRIKDGGYNKFIIVAIDHYTKWVEAKVLKDKSASTVKQAILELIITKHGIPERILSDCGLEFTNREAQELAKKYSFKWDFASPYHHQTVGAVERANQTPIRKLRKLTDYGRRPWPAMVQQAVRAINLSFNRAIGISPYLLKYGVPFKMNIDEDLAIPIKGYSLDKGMNKRKENFEKYKKSICKGEEGYQERSKHRGRCSNIQKTDLGQA
ncbi:Retrovirus-related Pol polyprotein from transposon 17.6 [Nosema granulosis]|uniref:Retrovirus-related Pol polyprotein from transposon 17.6 n=1 Tax=Nosema granulosis TaxID=83296 RepID=A0A9P6GWW7_9MICR|nr:Retrovirus-related Pol polyprotein from transposon 17.6 [Nosema granulosis]